MCYIYSVLLSIRKNEIVPFAATGMGLEMITLSQTEKDYYLMMSLTRII